MWLNSWHVVACLVICPFFLPHLTILWWCCCDPRSQHFIWWIQYYHKWYKWLPKVAYCFKLYKIYISLAKFSYNLVIMADNMAFVLIWGCSWGNNLKEINSYWSELGKYLLTVKTSAVNVPVCQRVSEWMHFYSIYCTGWSWTRLKPVCCFKTHVFLSCLPDRCQMQTWRWSVCSSASCLCSWWFSCCVTGTAASSTLFLCWRSFQRTAGSGKKTWWWNLFHKLYTQTQDIIILIILQASVMYLFTVYSWCSAYNKELLTAVMNIYTTWCSLNSCKDFLLVLLLLLWGSRPTKSLTYDVKHFPECHSDREVLLGSFPSSLSDDCPLLWLHGCTNEWEL